MSAVESRASRPTLTTSCRSSNSKAVALERELTVQVVIKALFLLCQYQLMNAAERVIEYAEVETEDLGGEIPPASWPATGNMEVKDLVVSYADGLPPVLKGISFDVKNNERIGVIGRTGAGKSSLTLALFRFLEARSGQVFIDGIDISKIRLYDLRSRLAIIPQVCYALSTPPSDTDC